ncbi:phage tail protein [Serratia sp. (in: enterobacteria)]|uniref:phage tail-collar fiber domain-containing protein n=1 Tax=Serratia sp. (in: enterobacteria) TaxID=616 RepID=UPI003989B179
MAGEFFAILTDAGKIALAQALITNIPVRITDIAVGDGAGQQYTPTPAQTQLRGETWRNPINNLRTVSDVSNQILAEGLIPTSVGGWYIREVGLFDDKGTMIAVSNYPETFKPLPTSGTRKQIFIEIIINVDNAAAVNLLVDENVAVVDRVTFDTLSGKVDRLNYPGATIIFDDANAVTKSDLLPVAIANSFRACIGPFHHGIASGYNYVTLPEMIDSCRALNGEILSHSMNGFVFDDTVELSVGESWLETSQLEFSQMGFNPHGFIAPGSVLASKFIPKLKACYDYAYIRSATMTNNTNAVNLPGTDRYNMVRVAIESITFERAKQYIDYAKTVGAYVCFYTHSFVSWLPDLMAYIKSNGMEVTPSEWVGKQWGITKDSMVLPTENLINNTSFQSLTPTSDPFNWTLDLSGLNAPTKKVTIGNGIGLMDINSYSNPAGAAGYLRYRHQTGPINVYTPICFSINASSNYSQKPGEVTTNTKVTLSMRLISVTGTLLRASPVRVYVATADRPVLYVNDGFVVPPSSGPAASHIDIEVKFETIAAGDTRIIFSSPQLERAGLPTRYKYSQFPSSYFSRIRRTTGLSIAANTVTTVAFNTVLEGSNYVYDTSTGVLSASDGRNYLLQVTLGLNGLAPGDSVILYLQVDGVANYPAYAVAALGKNVFNASWTVRGDSRAYSIAISHNSASARSITTFSDAALTISATN